MTALTRKLQKVFAGLATNNGVFGSGQAGTKVTSTNLDTLQSLPAYTNGWNDAVISGRLIPPLEEFQALNYINTYQLAYIFQEGIPEYEVGTEYRIASIVKKTGTTELYSSLINANIGNALGVQANTANWKYLGDLASLVNANPFSQDFRLCLATGQPAAYVTGATTIYCTPYKGNKISLYTGSAWVTRSSAEFSKPLGTLTSGKNYDVFCYDNAGVPTLEFLVWTNDTTRATALARQDGVLVKSGDATRRYLGYFYTTSTTTTEISATNLYLVNQYNKVQFELKREETTASWTYTSATVRQANANSANQLNFLCNGEDPVQANLRVACSNSSSGVQCLGGIGLDTTSLYSPSCFDDQVSVAGNVRMTSKSLYYGTPSAGRHFLSWNESGEAAGTTTWYGASTNNCRLSALMWG